MKAKINDKKISIIIAAYNEHDTIEKCVEQIVFYLENYKGIDYEIIVVDDGSTDGTWQTIEKIHHDYSQLKAVRFSRNFGKEAAIYAGLETAVGSVAIIMDADLQHPPSLLPKIIDLWLKEKAPIVEAVKEVRQKESHFHRVSAELFYWIFKKLTRIDLRRATDYKLLDRKVINAYLALPERIRFFRGLTAWMGFPTIYVPFVPAERQSDNSKWSFEMLIRLARYSLMSFTVIPLQLVSFLGLLTFVFSFVLGIHTLLNKILGKAVDGFTTVILVQLIIGSILMISLGLIGEYIGRIFEESKNRPLYIISENAPEDE